jgi:membrane protein DedA with SNARE-associated domain
MPNFYGISPIFFNKFFRDSSFLAYGIIFLGMFIEGELILILAGILIRGGHLDFLDTIFIAFGAVVIHDIAYWLIGKKLAERGGQKFLFFNLEKIKPFLEKIRNNNELYVFVSKFAWNLNRFVLIASGYIGTPFKKIIRYSLPAGFIWTITFISLGFIFAQKTEILKKDLKTVAVSLTIFLLAVIVLENLFQKIFNNDKK